MNLYNSIIERVPALCGRTAPKGWDYDPALAWPDAGAFELVMQRDQALELGGSGKPSVNFTCVTAARKCAKDVKDITMSLSQILKGMKELHFGRK